MHPPEFPQWPQTFATPNLSAILRPDATVRLATAANSTPFCSFSPGIWRDRVFHQPDQADTNGFRQQIILLGSSADIRRNDCHSDWVESIICHGRSKFECAIRPQRTRWSSTAPPLHREGTQDIQVETEHGYHSNRGKRDRSTRRAYQVAAGTSQQRRLTLHPRRPPEARTTQRGSRSHRQRPP